MMDESLKSTERALLKSHWFRSKPQMQRLLTYLLKHSYEDNEQALQQKAIATECLGRTDCFVPSQDPIVRIEAARLRKLLEAFYDEALQSAPYRISLPKGSYRVHISRNEDNALSAGLGLLLVCQSSQHTSTDALHLMLKIRREMADRFSRFHHVELTVEHLPKHQVAQKGSVHFLAEKQYDYVLRIEVVDDGKVGCLVSSVVIHRISQEILWSNSTLVPIDQHEASLEVFYKHLMRSLVADSFGLLGRHWSHFARQVGGENLPSHQASWIHLIALVNQPNAEFGRHYLAFLNSRLRKYPGDYVAYAGYLFLAFYDLMFDFKLMDSSVEEQREQLLRVVREHPTYDAFTVLLGMYSFAAGKYEDAKAYLKTGMMLNPHNTCWGFLYGGALFFMGDKAQGIDVINQANKDFHESHALPSYYLLPEFLHHLEQGNELKVFQMGIKLGFNTKQYREIGELKSHPELIDYCWKAIRNP